MRILMLGDVVGQNGSSFIRKKLPAVRRQYQADLVMVNGENSAEGNGILPASAKNLWDSGADIITLGNHGLRRREIYEMLEQEETLIRPANFHPSAPGRGWCIYDCPGKPRVAVVNLAGTCYMECSYYNPFDVIDEILPKLDAEVILVDFHAEATSEKFCMGYYLDGRVTAVVGTHTHVQTADERILPGGTAYLTDLGMCGSFNSALGVKPELALRRFRTNLPTRFENDPGVPRMSGALIVTEGKGRKAVSIERINIEG